MSAKKEEEMAVEEEEMVVASQDSEEATPPSGEMNARELRAKAKELDEEDRQAKQRAKQQRPPMTSHPGKTHRGLKKNSGAKAGGQRERKPWPENGGNQILTDDDQDRSDAVDPANKNASRAPIVSYEVETETVPNESYLIEAHLVQAELIPDDPASNKDEEDGGVIVAAQTAKLSDYFQNRNMQYFLGGLICCFVITVTIVAVVIVQVTRSPSAESDPDTQLPTTVTPMVGSTPAPTTSSPTPNPTSHAPSSSPTTSVGTIWTHFDENTVGIYNLRFRFEDDQVPMEDPTEDQLSALMCSTERHLSDLLRNSTGQAAAEFLALDIGYSRRRDPVDSSLQFVITFTCGFSSNETTSFLTQDGYLQLSLLSDLDKGFDPNRYVLDSGALMGFFANVNNVTTDHEFGPPAQRVLKEARCGLPAVVFFTLEFGFWGGWPERSPTTAEIQDLICETSKFIQGRVQNATEDDQSVVVQAVDVSWIFDEESATLPVSVGFAMEVSYQESGEPVPLPTVFDSMKVTTEELASYILNYVWNVDQDSIFQHANTVYFTNEAYKPFPQGKLDVVLCDAARMLLIDPWD